MHHSLRQPLAAPVIRARHRGTPGILLLAIAIFASDAPALADSYTVLRDLLPTGIGKPVYDGTALYVTADFGGPGRIIKLSLDGSEYTVLHSFAGGQTDGYNVRGSLALADAVLYGVTRSGGAFNEGTLFRIGTDGSGFEILHSFTGMIGGGEHPRSSPIVVGTTIYGSSERGGLYSVNLDGTGFTSPLVYVGSYPNTLLQIGSSLYGTTQGGGLSGGGTIIKLNLDGSGYSVLRYLPWTSWSVLASDGFTLYGTTRGGGANSNGTIFRINTDGSGFQLLHEFSAITDGRELVGSLTLSGSTLYGTTPTSGPNGFGTLFQINTDGTGFTVLHAFAGGADGGGNLDAPILIGDTLYGLTGSSDGFGGVFYSYQIPEPAALAILAPFVLLLPRRRR